MKKCLHVGMQVKVVFCDSDVKAVNVSAIGTSVENLEDGAPNDILNYSLTHFIVSWNLLSSDILIETAQVPSYPQ